MSFTRTSALFFLLAAVLALTLLYLIARPSLVPPTFSAAQVLSAVWHSYKDTYVESGTYRTVDKQRGNITTSEGQSYTMLRAVWEGDEETFDGAWRWTKEYLGRPHDHLFSWLWGTRSDGTTGILTERSGENSASDADTDIALSLIFAYARWQEPEYLTEARNIVNDIWKNEVITIQGVPYLSADDIEKKSETTIVINPSYLHPAAYHLFSLIDTAHPWETLRTSSYELIAKSSGLPLGEKPSSGLPPDWIQVDRRTGAIQPYTESDSKSHFSYDAMRLPLRVALDAEWFNNEKAVATLKDFSFLSKAWSVQNRLGTVYAHDGTLISPDESLALYGGTMGYFAFVDPEAAKTIYSEKLLSEFNPNTNNWKKPLSYYDDNWAWFGIALYSHELTNLAAQLPSSAFSK